MRAFRNFAQQRRALAGDEGGVLILVLIIGVLLVASLGVAVAATTSSLSFTTMFKTDSQSEMAAQTGLATELTAMEAVTDYTSFPCSASGSLDVTGASSSYSTTVSYSANGSALSCAGSTLGGSTAPTNATLTSVGKAEHATTVTMKEDVEIAVTPSNPAEVGYAIYTSNNIVLEAAATLTTGTATPDIYAGQQVNCQNGTTSTGSITTYQPVDFSGSCNFAGNLTSAGYVELQNSATIQGDVISYGGDTAATSCGSTSSGSGKSKVTTYYAICLSGAAAIKGNATETNGNIEVPDGEIYGNADASGAISVSGGGKIAGTSTPDDSSLSSETMPAATTFPSLSPPSSGWNVVDIPNSSYTCAQYFQSISNEAGSGPSVAFPDPFQLALENQTEKTIYYAPSCDVSYSNAQVFAQNPTGGDAFLDVAKISFSNSNTFCEETAEDSGTCSSSTSVGDHLVIEANGPPPTPPATYSCSTSTVDESFSNASKFYPNVDVLLYSMGEISFANDSVMTGQIQACGGVIGTNTFQLQFDPSAADEVYGAAGGSVTISILDKYVASG
jgi:cytoskeletal protein CcmA (bactofilin family)